MPEPGAGEPSTSSLNAISLSAAEIERFGPDPLATFRATVGEMRKLMDNGVRTVVLMTNKASTTLNLSLLCEGQNDTTKVTLRHISSSAVLHVGLRCRRDLLVGRDSNYGGYASPVEDRLLPCP